MHQIVDSGLKGVWPSRESADWHYRLRIMSSVGREIIGWRWLEAGGTTGEHPPIPLWGCCPWKPAVATLRWGHSTVTDAPLMPTNERWVTVWVPGKKKNNSLSLFLSLTVLLDFFFFLTGRLCVSPQVESVYSPQLQQHLASEEDRQIGQPRLPNKALLKLHASVRVMPWVQHGVGIMHCFILTCPCIGQALEKIEEGQCLFVCSS